MKHARIKRSYLDWIEGNLGEEERRKIERHIRECDLCRSYYEKMSRILEKTDPALLPHLAPEPFSATRIRAIAAPRRERRSGTRAAWARRSLAAMALLVAVTAGVYLGRGLSSNGGLAEETELAEAYYEAFSPTDIAGGWAGVMTQTESNGQNGQGKGDR
jgi:predicted anti-sigma-YlaC factor YlaD